MELDEILENLSQEERLELLRRLLRDAAPEAQIEVDESVAEAPEAFRGAPRLLQSCDCMPEMVCCCK